MGALNPFKWANGMLILRQIFLRRGLADREVLRPQVMNLLVFFSERAGEVVTTEEILDQVWPGTFVGSGSIYNCINELRQAFGDSPKPHRYIETISKRGYRLIATVDWKEKEPSLSSKPHAITALLSILFFAVIGTLAFKTFNKANTMEFVNQSQIPTLAVLPFADFSEKQSEAYFSAGLAEELLNILARVDGLHVVSRTSSFRIQDHKLADITAIAETLGARYVLEGSIRRNGKELAVTAQLIDAESDLHLWSDIFQIDSSTKDLMQVQSSIARAIVGSLAANSNVGDIDTVSFSAASDTDNLDAYQSYLKGLEVFRQRDLFNLKEAISHFEKAVRLDPEFSRAWEFLAASYVVAPSNGLFDQDYMTMANDAAQKALALNPDLAMPYAVIGYAALFERKPNYRTALMQFHKALEVDPRDSRVWSWRGQLNAELGFFNKAIADLERCLELDPDDHVARHWLAQSHLFNGDVNSAMIVFEPIYDTEFSPLRYHLAFTLAKNGKVEEAIRMIEHPNPAAHDMEIEGRAILSPILDTDYDMESGHAAYRNFIETNLGVPKHIPSPPFFLLIYKRYDSIGDPRPISGANVHWYRLHEDFLSSPERNRIIRELGIEEYWRRWGFPPQCKPVDEANFECA